MKNSWLRIVTVLLLLSLAATGVVACTSNAPAPTAAKPTVLKFAHYVLDTDVRGISVNNFAKRVNELTKGQVQIQVYPAETLVKSKDTMDAVVNGIADMGYLLLSNSAGKLPVLDALTTGPAIADVKKAGSVWNELRPIFEEGYNKFDITMLWFTPIPDAMWYFKKPVTKLEDLKGLLIRSYGGGSDLIVQLAGATPVYVTAPETYMAAQKGTVDAAVGGFGTFYSTKAYEVLPYIVQGAEIMGCGTMAMNMKVFNSLSKDSQNAIRQAAKEAQDWYVTAAIDSWNQKLKDGQAQKLFNVYTLPAAERARWANAWLPYYDAMGKKLGTEVVAAFAKAVPVFQKYQ